MTPRRYGGRTTPLGLLIACLASAGGLACYYPGPVKHMREVANVDTTPGADEAVVVFVRPTGAAPGVQWSVFEVEEKRPASLVGILGAMKKVAYRTWPGRHLFMCIGPTPDFVTANLEAGKLYYVLMMPNMGDFVLQPVRGAEHEQLRTRLSQTGWVETTDDSLKWAHDNREDIEAKRFKFYGIWRRRPSFERLALYPDDGR